MGPKSSSHVLTSCTEMKSRLLKKINILPSLAEKLSSYINILVTGQLFSNGLGNTETGEPETTLPQSYPGQVNFS